MNSAPEEMMGRRGNVGLLEMDGWREIGCCVTCGGSCPAPA